MAAAAEVAAEEEEGAEVEEEVAAAEEEVMVPVSLGLGGARVRRQPFHTLEIAYNRSGSNLVMAWSVDVKCKCVERPGPTAWQ